MHRHPVTVHQPAGDRSTRGSAVRYGQSASIEYANIEYANIEYANIEDAHTVACCS